MTQTRIATAPGKVVLSGEYAVLDGAPAVCMAIDRRARVTLTSADHSTCIVRAPGFAKEEGRFCIVEGGLEWISGGARFEIIDAAWAAGARVPAGSVIELDTRAFVDEATGAKTGIGSSAALIVAIMAATGASLDVFDPALSAHRYLQGGAGSGIDVAAAVHGGLIEYGMKDAEVRSLTRPGGLAFRVIFAGVPASTGHKLAALAAGATAPSRKALGAASADIAAAWAGGDAEGVLRAYPAYVAALRRFDVDHDLGIFDAGHGRLTDEAQKEGLVYKPAGAGGGDVGVLFGTDAEVLEDFLARHIAEPQRVLSCELDPRGVMLELS